MPPAALVALAGAVCAVVGSSGPWASVAGELYSGGQVERFQIDGMIGDGAFTLGLSAAAALLILMRVARSRISGFLTGTAAVLLMVATLTAMLNWVDVGNMPGVYEPGKYYHTDARAAWGLIMTTLGSAAGAVAMAFQVWMDELR